MGLKASYWELDDQPDSLSASPPANGFGLISHPAFGNIDISSTIPTDTFTATSSINAYTLDFEATKKASLDKWFLSASSGLRLASVEQSYLAQLRDGSGTLRGSIDHRQKLEGFGPTFGIETIRPLGCNLLIFGRVRGYLLFADADSTLRAVRTWT